jgi:hypothetical protein
MILLTKNEQHIAFLVTLQLGHTRINSTLQLGHNRIYSSIHSFIYIPLGQSAHMIENPYIHCILHLFDRSISTHFIHLFKSIKKRFCMNCTSV